MDLLLQNGGSEMSNEKELGGIDYFKVLAAFLVVAIHISPLTSYSITWDFIFTRIICRIAVPYFFMVTGYFLLMPYLFKQSEDSRAIYSFVKKTLTLYLLAIIICLPVNIYAKQFSGTDIFDIIRLIVFDGTLYHLWYLPASILGVILVYLASLKFSFKTIFVASIILFTIGLFGDSYYGFIKNTPIISDFYGGMFNIFTYTRNGIFYAPLFLVLGAYLRHSERKYSVKVYVAGFIVSLALMIGEGMTLHNLGVQRHDSMYFALLPCMFFLFQITIAVRLNQKQSLRVIATWIYVLHPIVIVLVRGMAKALHMENIFVSNSLIHYASVSIISLLIAVVIEKFYYARKTQLYPKGRAWIEIDRASLKRNVEELSKVMPHGCKLMPVLKANAYGHGAVLVARELNALKIYSFCVATISEAVELRRNNIKGEILILGYTHPEQFSLLKRYGLTQTVVDASYAKELNSYGIKLKVYIKIDTGMHRLGERSSKIESLCSIFECKNLVIRGAYTHLCDASATASNDKAFTKSQEEAFFSCVEALKKLGCICPSAHLQSSYGLLNYPEIKADYIRVGIALYGTLSTYADTENCAVGLKPILSLKARVALVQDLFEGENAGYELAYTAHKNMKIATLSIGYADGVPRSLSCGKGHVLINGSKAPIIGLICMDQMLVDVSDVDNPQAGDVAVVIGKSVEQEITVSELSEASGTIANEFLSRLSNRIVRMAK